MNTQPPVLFVYDPRVATWDGPREEDPARLNCPGCYTHVLEELSPVEMDDRVDGFRVCGQAQRRLVDIALGGVVGDRISQDSEKKLLFTGTMAILGDETYGAGRIRLVTDVKIPFTDSEGLRELILGSNPSTDRVHMLLRGFASGGPEKMRFGYHYCESEGTNIRYHYRTQQELQGFFQPERIVGNPHTYNH